MVFTVCLILHFGIHDAIGAHLQEPPFAVCWKPCPCLYQGPRRLELPGQLHLQPGTGILHIFQVMRIA